MSVFTPLSDQDVRDFMRQFDLGELLGFEGISGGSENTNYFVDCSSGRYVLTLVERGPVQDLPFLVRLLDRLQAASLPVPFAFRNRDADALLWLKDKPALLQPCLPGRHPDTVNARQCAALGEFLARLHCASSALQRKADRGPHWVMSEAHIFCKDLWAGEADWLTDCLARLQASLDWLHNAPALPQSLIHGDLFRDNAMFEGDRLSGVIDFHNAATGWTLLELAICANDWCVDVGTADDPQQPHVNAARLCALLDAYLQQRSTLSNGSATFSPLEQQAWPHMLQLAALRFWLSRQQYALQHSKQPGVLIKDPDYFRRLLKMHYLSSLA